MQSTRQVLYAGPSEAQFAALVDAMPAPRGAPRSPRTALVDVLGQPWRIDAATSVSGCVEALGHDFYNLLILDLRCAGDGGCFRRQKADALAVLDALDKAGDVEARYGFHRILLLVSGFDGEEVDKAIIEIGQRGVGAVLRQECRVGISCHPTDPPFARRLLSYAKSMVEAPRSRRRALCAAGGGITGIYFELGALKCLDDCLSHDAINSFDMYFGISAGAVVSSLIAVGYSVDELMAAILGLPESRLDPIDMRLFRFAHLDRAELWRRFGLAVEAVKETLSLGLRGRWPELGTLLVDYADIAGPLFRTAGFGEVLATAMGKDGASNDFRQLPTELYIGATNQDTRSHVLFGGEGRDSVPISRAVEASMALNPAFTATEVEGEQFEDGAVTRTSNFVEAIRRGADLVITIDPFLPFVSREAGFSRRRGVLYNIDQNIRTMSYTRFANTRDWMLRRHPNVSSYTFVPQNSLRKLLSVSPFDHRPHLAIWRGAYLSTLARLERVGHRLGGDLAAQGIRLDLARGQAVAARLRRLERPSLADFFPDGRLALKQLPLCGQANHPARLAA